jgi:transposase
VWRLGIDEIAARKGPDYFHLILVDLDAGRVIKQLPVRGSATLQTYLQSRSAAARAPVEEVAVDFWTPYHGIAAALLLQARVVADRFHVQQHLNDAVQRTRRAIQAILALADAAFVRRHRHLLVYHEDDLHAAAGRAGGTQGRGAGVRAGTHAQGAVRRIYEEAPDRPSATAR